MHVNLHHPTSEFIGYGQMALSLRDALQRRGVVVVDDPAQIVCWMSVPSHANGWWANQIPMVLTMWESMRLPETFRERLRNFETIMVPSEQNVELFGEYHDNVRYVPLGIDPARWRYRKRHVGEFFDFLIGGSGARKGNDLAFKAFQKVFRQVGSGPIPRLIMKGPRGAEFKGDRVMHVTGHISPAEEVALYHSAHCYVQPSRGEGFGLQPLQAIASGMPTILTDAHGHKAFSYLGYGISAKPAQTAYFSHGPAGMWWEPDFDELCDHMRWVYDNYAEATERAEGAAAAVKRQHTWDNTADRFVDVVGAERMTMLDETGPWVKPVLDLFRVKVTRNIVCDIGPSHYEFKAGEEYQAPADVHRVMSEAGYLDAECLL